MVLTNKVGTEATRLWYAAQAIEHGWSRNVLEHHIGSLLHTRVDRSPTPARIPVAPVDSELVRDLVKDPYVWTSFSSTPATRNVWPIG